jgi:hypothetical protein
MARKKKKKKGGLLSFFSKKKKTKRSKRKDSDSFVTGLRVALSMMFLTVLGAGGAVGLIYMDRFVKNAAKEETKTLPVIFYWHGEDPKWLQQEWYDLIYSAIGGGQFVPNESLAHELQGKLTQFPWLYDTTVKITPDTIKIISGFRRPIGWVQSGRNRKIYLDVEMTVLDYIPVAAIPVIEINGLSSVKVPEPGQKWAAEDVAAAVELLNLLYMADLHFQQENGKRENDALPEKKIPEKPLLNEIKSVDVSNFAARKSRSAPNIVLNVADGTKVYWGAAWGQANVYFEADEKDKLARLYQFFMDHHNTLGGAAKYIELRWPQDSIPRPR